MAHIWVAVQQGQRFTTFQMFMHSCLVKTTKTMHIFFSRLCLYTLYTWFCRCRVLSYEQNFVRGFYSMIHTYFISQNTRDKEKSAFELSLNLIEAAPWKLGLIHDSHILTTYIHYFGQQYSRTTVNCVNAIFIWVKYWRLKFI